MQYKRTKLLPSSLRCLPSSWRWRQLAANGRRRQQLAKTLRRPTCGLFIKLRPFVPAHVCFQLLLCCSLVAFAAGLLSATVSDSNLSAAVNTAARYESEPETQEGRKELAERAKSAEERRNTSLAKYHNFEIASAALEIGIVLASATIITGITVLAWIAGTLGVVGLAFMGIALIAPHTVHVL